MENRPLAEVKADLFKALGHPARVRALELLVDGERTVFPPASAGFVHPDRLMDPCTVPGALVLDLVLGTPSDVPGSEIATVDAVPGLDRDALDRLVAQADGARIALGDDLESALADLPGDQGELVGARIAFRLTDEPERVLLVRDDLDLLIEHPPISPALDPDDLVTLRDSMGPDVASVVATDLTAHLLDRAELEAFRPDLVASC